LNKVQEKITSDNVHRGIYSAICFAVAKV